ncbi:N-terminal acetyltransferase A complex auxiliary subunit NAA15-like [Humulus lupulus]|uniref:N-terminal acetyltransferase A complex auxiliary subunit NAA15-like n=1 Tax=Humulus lupulus TaxID=3486 RepID=UPI002B409192|nr:N-terminal acetyltransferase A complex auxiliary subunit NAA15-like [Humulus lupulus]
MAQMRDLAGFVETKQQLLSLKSNHRMNWIGFAVAHHLNSKYIEMISLEQFLTTFVVEAFRMEECISLIFVYISCFVFSDKGI